MGNIANALCWLCVISMMIFGAVWAHSIWTWFSYDDKFGAAARATMDRQWVGYTGIVASCVAGLVVVNVSRLFSK